MYAPLRRREPPFVAARRALREGVLLRTAVRRRYLPVKLEMIDEAAVRGDEIRDDSHRVGLGMKLGAHARFDDSAHGVARELPGPLRQSLPRYPFPAPAPAQIRSERHDPAQPVPPGDE